MGRMGCWSSLATHTCEGNGKVLVSPVAHRESIRKMGLEDSLRANVGGFTAAQQAFLAFHRESVFLEARYNR